MTQPTSDEELRGQAVNLVRKIGIQSVDLSSIFDQEDIELIERIIEAEMSHRDAAKEDAKKHQYRSLCGCVMCTHHTVAYEMQAERCESDLVRPKEDK